VRPDDLPSAKELGARKPHGHKMRYMAGCRCWRCRAGNSAYERKMKRDRRLYGPNDLVPSDKVRAHLKELQRFGMGHKTVAKHAGVGKTVLAEILWYGKEHVRRRTERKILCIRANTNTLPKNTHIPAKETLRLIRRLLSEGISKRRINHDALGNRSDGLQIRALYGRSRVVEVKTALKIRAYFRRIMY